MNLHSIVGPVVAAVNPTVEVIWRQSNGQQTNADFSRTPIYKPDVPVPAQIQALQFTDLKQIEGLSISGLRRKVYFYGNLQGIVRGEQKGGDLIIFPDGSEWLIAFVFETWGQGLRGSAGWCSCCLTLQNPASEG